MPTARWTARPASLQDYTGNVNGPILWNLNLLDARMDAVSETYGNGLWLQNGFDPLTGDPLTRQSGTGGQSSNVQNLSYVWDTAGNLSHRQVLLQSITETFSYDALDIGRLGFAGFAAGVAGDIVAAAASRAFGKACESICSQ